ncbi:MAG: flagellar hook-basal body complex protein [Synergistaceae bacterium]|nr:flagellar hook-basal body complex protein [Synergistaceae bacterium]
MLRALMTAVTGVRAHQTMLDVTGNNIANANTTGFKKDNTIFADLMYQANKYASGSGDTRGGINPAQVGLGVSVSAIETIHTQGSSSFTGNASDMMIQGKGFFVYANGNSQLFSRSGALVLDNNSDVVMSGQGYKLQGYKMEDTPLDGYQQAAELSTVNIPLGQKIDAKATTRVDYQCNLDSRTNAYLSYGFADLPFNVVAGWKGNSTGTAQVNMDGTNYDMSFMTDFQATTNTDTSGVNYLNITIANGDNETQVTFDMVNVDNTTGLPKLALPKINRNADDTANVGSQTVGTNNFVGWLSPDMTFIDDPTTATATDQATLDKYIPVYQFPGQVPPTYFAAQYDDTTGSLKFRSVTFTPADEDAPVLDVDATNIKANPTLFTYNIKDNMNYTNFQLSGTATVEDGGDPVNVSYNFIAEFDESVTTGGTNSELSKMSSKMTLWYYGLSTADGADGTPAMHKLDATVYFSADGSFDSVEWSDTTNDNAPLGYRIVDDDTGTANFRISAGQSSQTSSKTDTLNFQQAQNLDTPADKWNTMGTAYQGGYHATKLTIYDDNGKDHTLEVTFKKITENRWRWEAFLVEKNDADEDVLSNIIPQPSSGEIEFDGSGRISNAVTSENARRGDGNDRYPNAEVELTIPFSLNGQPNSVVTLNFGGGVGSGGSALDGVTQFASATTTKPVYQDGYTMGVLENYSVAENGIITGSYDNGVNIPLYRVAVATFANEQGLEKVGNTMFQATVNSGNANIDGATTNGKGKIMSQYVEMSNVDLTEEFTHLIIAQRGFQANARTVTVSDQILEEVVNLKR